MADTQGISARQRRNALQKAQDRVLGDFRDELQPGIICDTFDEPIQSPRRCLIHSYLFPLRHSRNIQPP